MPRVERPDAMASLAVEGRSMFAALAADLSAIRGVEVAALRDRRLGHSQPKPQRCIDVDAPYQRDAAFDRLAAEADWTVVIAPEIGGILFERCRRVGEIGGRLLGGSLEMVLLAGDKHATAEHLAKAGVPVPRGIPLILGQPWPKGFPYPAVWKPLDGAGSEGLRLISHRQAPMPPSEPRPGRLEEVCPRFSALKDVPAAAAASVAFLCGPAGYVELPACRQRLTESFRYLGGSTPLPPPLSERASRLARRAVETLPGPLGFVGVDLVLAPEDAAHDVVIEINPRLTTSYVGLRAACRENLAAAMLAMAAGQPFRLSFRDTAIEWEAGGRVHEYDEDSFSASA